MKNQVLTSNQEVENTHPDLKISELLSAQKKSWEVLKQITEVIVPGVSELEGVKIISEKLKALGVERSWHHPVFRIGENTTKPYFVQASEEKRLSPNDIYYIDIGPVFCGSDGIEYEGDVGNTFSLSNEPAHKKVIEASQSLFKLACEKWKLQNVTGVEIYRWLSEEAIKMGLRLVHEDDGHRIGDFPHKRIFAGGLTQVDFCPQSGLWVLEVHVMDLKRNIGAFFEDILK